MVNETSEFRPVRVGPSDSVGWELFGNAVAAAPIATSTAWSSAIVKLIRLAAALVAGGLLLAGCGSSAANDAAQAAYDACLNPKADPDLLRIDGDTVQVEVIGDNAKALAGFSDAADNLTTTGKADDDDVDGFVVGMLMMSAVDCLVEETGYPGTSDALTDGEEWDGWTYSEEAGAGSEVTFSFKSTS